MYISSSSSISASISFASCYFSSKSMINFFSFVLPVPMNCSGTPHRSAWRHRKFPAVPQIAQRRWRWPPCRLHLSSRGRDAGTWARSYLARQPLPQPHDINIFEECSPFVFNSPHFGVCWMFPSDGILVMHSLISHYVVSFSWDQIWGTQWPPDPCSLC